MGQKVDPIGLRLGINKDWESKWYASNKNFAKFLNTDIKIRKYLDKEVSQELLEKIIETGRYAPSGGNSQSNHFLVIQNKQIIDHLVKMVERAFSQMEITENMYRSLQNSINLSKKGGYVFCYNAPVLIIVANKKDYGNNQADCALALENMMLEANELDLGSCYINQLHWLRNDDKIRDFLFELGIPKEHTICSAAAIGYIGKESSPPPRKKDTIHIIR